MVINNLGCDSLFLQTISHYTGLKSCNTSFMIALQLIQYNFYEYYFSSSSSSYYYTECLF